jgi:hypothetical protein
MRKLYERIAMRKLSSREARLIMLQELVAGRLRWEFFPGSTREGELCWGGMRYATVLERDVPMLPGHLAWRILHARKTLPIDVQM